MELTAKSKKMFIETAKTLHGSDRRIFMAQVVELLGSGGQRRAASELGWDRDTIRKGQHELRSGFRCQDNFSGRGRQRAEERWPHLLADIKAIVDEQSQTDPSFKTTRLYTRLSAAQVRQQLIVQKGYPAADLPCAETIRLKLNQLGYYPSRVQKSQPLKKIAETEAIFEQVHAVNRAADQEPTQLRISMDAKATVLIGLLSRDGVARVKVKALDHDFRPDETVTPFGLFLPQYNELYLYFTSSRLTSDFIVDCLQDCWSKLRERFPHVQTLVLNQDNGPENHSRRTQFIHRLVDFADTVQLTVKLAYYPPYHSKYNPIERVWAVLEKHWNGTLLDSLQTVLNFARTMTWKNQPPVVQFVAKVYHTGVRLTQKAMNLLEKRLTRLPGLEKWFVTISPLAP
jgi:hypothetical protein